MYTPEDVNVRFNNNPQNTSLASRAKEKRLVIYGNGDTFKFFHEIVLSPLSLDVSVIIDQRHQLSYRKDGITYTYLEDRILEAYKDDALVIVCIGLPEQSYQVEQTLKNMGFADVARFDQFYDYQKVYGYDLSAQDISVQVQTDWQDVLDAYTHLSDEDSKDIYWNVIATHLNSTVQQIKNLPQHNQYFEFDLFACSDYQHALQLGGFDGDTFRNAQAHSDIFDTIMVLEPCGVNFKKLYDFLHHSYADRKLQIINAAAGAAQGKLSFAAGGGPTARARDGQNVTSVPIWPVDQLELITDPTFIFIDIEGAESQALDGMTSTLLRAKPNLAISAYHHPYDIYRITNRMAETGLFSAFYLRNYSGSVVDTVLYCKSKQSG